MCDASVGRGVSTISGLPTFAGWRPRDLPADMLAGLTLAAIAIPEQMATAGLAGLPPERGFLALAAGALGFALCGASRRMSVGADSTITPIFAGALAMGAAPYSGEVALLALLVGLALVVAGALRLGFVADLLSIPVTTGFLAGVAAHILASQAPALMGVAAPQGPTPLRIWTLAQEAGAAQWAPLALGLGVTASILAGERLAPRFPAALVALVVATALNSAFDGEAHGVETLGALSRLRLHVSAPPVSYAALRDTAGLALIVAAVAMMQTAATSRAFVDASRQGADVDRDFIGVGAANLLAAALGAFPVNASPPRTAVVAQTGGRSQLGALGAGAAALGLALWGGGVFAHVPKAALAGVLVFVALRILRVRAMADVARCAPAEFGLIALTFAAIVALPIEQGVGVGIALSILHGLWTVTRARIVEYVRIPGTSIWWPRSSTQAGETLPGVTVIGVQAPLSFLNAHGVRDALLKLGDARLLVIEANAIVEIDYTGANVLADAVRRLQGAGVTLALARLESVRAQEGFARHGLTALIGENRIFHSVEQAVGALAPVDATPARAEGGPL